VTLLHDLRSYLDRVETTTSPPTYSPQLAVHRKHVFKCLNRLETGGGENPHRIGRLTQDWARQLESFVRRVGDELVQGVAYGEPVAVVESLIDVAIARELRLPDSTGSIATDAEIDRARSNLAGAEDVTRYAAEIRVVRRDGARRRVTPAGRLVLDLPDRDAVRWLLTLEAVQSLGNDPWRISRAAAAEIVLNATGSLADDGSDEWLPSVRWGTLVRLVSMGLAVTTWDFDVPVVSWAILPFGIEILREIETRADSPFSVLAQSILADETTTTIEGRHADAARVAAEGATAAVARHSRMVLHELRNVLVPLRSRVERLASTDSKQLASITQGFDRAFDFLERVARASDVSPEPREPFALDAAIRDAVPDLGSDLRLNLSDVPGAPIFGRRDRFVLAIVNVLRNAAQAREAPPVQVWISSTRSNGSVELYIDDDGPGVPEADREAIFEESFTRRLGGTGQGLALVREIVEREIGGRVTCEASARGGARFRIRVPVSKRGTP
jgi:signal transduction histidine kinase